MRAGKRALECALLSIGPYSLARDKASRLSSVTSEDGWSMRGRNVADCPAPARLSRLSRFESSGQPSLLRPSTNHRRTIDWTAGFSPRPRHASLRAAEPNAGCAYDPALGCRTSADPQRSPRKSAGRAAPSVEPRPSPHPTHKRQGPRGVVPPGWPCQFGDTIPFARTLAFSSARLSCAATHSRRHGQSCLLLSGLNQGVKANEWRSTAVSIR